MRVLALVRLVPDSRAALKVARDGTGIETAGVAMVCDPFDELAVEQAVRLRESRPDVSEAIVLSFGPPPPGAADQALRTALAMGCDRGIYVHGAPAGAPGRHDEVYLARVLAAVIRREESRVGPIDLILCGKQAIDNDSGELGPALAEFLDRPHVGAITRLEIGGSGLRAHRRSEGGEEVVESTLPALVTCAKGLAEPRYPALPNIMKAKKKPVEMVAAGDLTEVQALAPATRLVRLSPPPARAPCRMVAGEPPEMARELVRLLHEEARVV
jgi:electron transfer flavoprotein beta subunit